ncbi:helix-turn-helix domain-containing protein [Rhizobium sp. CRIBSB]|nr:helix-turn-helix domain-containing protein [Rhizobium sp. CRIBSB]
MVKSLDPKKIKSAQRALEVLEYFSDARPTATVMDIARAMGYPQSSTSELLNCLVALGYLDRDRDARTYRPTARVAVIGSSVQPELFRKGRLLAILDHLAEEADLTVTLAHRVGMSMQHIHVVPGPHADFDLPPLSCLATSSVGQALLATYDPVLVRKLVLRLNAEADEAAPLICANDLADSLRAASIRGYAVQIEALNGSLAMLIPQTRGTHPLILSIHGPASRFEVELDWLLQMVRGAIARLTNPAMIQSLIETGSDTAERIRRAG